jgi:hypothetical protein
MSLIFNWDARKGSYIDQVSKIVGTPTDVEFKRTEKGTAGKFNEDSSLINYPKIITTIPFTVSFAIKVNNFDISTTLQEGWIVNQFAVGDGRFVINTIGDKKIRGFIGGTSIFTNTISEGEWYHIIFTRNASGLMKFYLNNIEQSNTATKTNAISDTAFKLGTGSIGSGDFFLLNVDIYNYEISSQERNTLYQEFLQSGITEKPTRNFEYPEKTELQEDGLVAAYSFNKRTVVNE